MNKKASFSISFFFIWLAIFGLGFTTISFYKYNPKLMFVEITEERGEDGNDMNEEDGDVKDSFDSVNEFHNVALEFNSSPNKSNKFSKEYATSTGYLLDLIKPPLA